MDTQPHAQGSGCTPTVFMIVGGVIMLLNGPSGNLLPL